MLNMTRIFTFLLFSFSISLFAQTTISGVIAGSQTWDKAGSPYLITSNSVLNDSGKLTIEKGVVIQISANVKIQLRGSLWANGTADEPIIIEAADSEKWKGFSMQQTGQDGFELHNVTISGAEDLFETDYQEWSNPGVVDSCSFMNNDIVFYFDKTLNVSNTLFENNATVGDYVCRVSFDNCVFENNEKGLSTGCTPYPITNCRFVNNGTGVTGEGIQLENCLFIGNVSAVKSYYRGASIDSCEFIGNGDALILEGAQEEKHVVTNSYFCDNDSVVRLVNNNRNLNFSSNCFCDEQFATLNDAVWDIYDNLDLGEVVLPLQGACSWDPILATESNGNELNSWWYESGLDVIGVAPRVKSVVIYDLLGNKVTETKNHQIELPANFSVGCYLMQMEDLLGKRETVRIYKN
jgi:hypothetical protein